MTVIMTTTLPLQALPPRTFGRRSKSPPAITRRLLSITLALQLSGAPRPDSRAQRLLKRYVAGHLSLAQLLPRLWPGSSSPLKPATPAEDRHSWN
jgi:hypothetical protein